MEKAVEELQKKQASVNETIGDHGAVLARIESKVDALSGVPKLIQDRAETCARRHPQGTDRHPRSPTRSDNGLDQSLGQFLGQNLAKALGGIVVAVIIALVVIGIVSMTKGH